VLLGRSRVVMKLDYGWEIGWVRTVMVVGFKVLW
jgi:hypothetical protein